MFCLGCDVGSLTAKAVIIDTRNDKIEASHIMPVLTNAKKSSETVIRLTLEKAGRTVDEIDRICSTGYGRFECSFPSDEMSEISCHGIGAFWSKESVRTIIDIGGQDSKVISVDDHGLVSNFKMNDKCAAGTGRMLELLSESLGLQLDKLGAVALKGKGKLNVSNRCGIFMEMDVIRLMRSGKKTSEIACAISEAVASRVKQIVRVVGIKNDIVMTGGVSKNRAVAKHLEDILNVSFVQLPYDPQLMGAIGAAVFASRSLERNIK